MKESTTHEIWRFLKQRKKFWLLPCLVALFMAGLVIIFGGASVSVPLIYALF